MNFRNSEACFHADCLQIEHCYSLEEEENRPKRFNRPYSTAHSRDGGGAPEDSSRPMPSTSAHRPAPSVGPLPGRPAVLDLTANGPASAGMAAAAEGRVPCWFDDIPIWWAQRRQRQANMIHILCLSCCTHRSQRNMQGLVHMAIEFGSLLFESALAFLDEPRPPSSAAVNAQRLPPLSRSNGQVDEYKQTPQNLVQTQSLCYLEKLVSRWVSFCS